MPGIDDRMMRSRPTDRPAGLVRRWAAAAWLGASIIAAGGCQTIGAVFGGMAANNEKSSIKDVTPRYDGLRGKSFAVVVAADRVIQADYPSVVGDLTLTISRRLADAKNDVGASGYVPGDKVLGYQYNNPRWVAMTPEELARGLGVQRLVFIDLQEYRLNDPGNQYLWAGVAAGTVRVVEADGKTPGVFIFQEPVRVQFPDKDGYGPGQLPAQAVSIELSRRFCDRAAWLFHQHEEPNSLKY